MKLNGHFKLAIGYGVLSAGATLASIYNAASGNYLPAATSLFVAGVAALCSRGRYKLGKGHDELTTMLDEEGKKFEQSVDRARALVEKENTLPRP